MIRLTATSEKLQAVLAGAITTTQPQAVVCYSDQTSSGYSGGKQVTALNSTVDVDILAAPAASTIRDVDFLSIHNRDSASVTVTIKYDISATDSIIIAVTLATLETLEYTHGSGWKVIDVNGNLKTSASGTPTGVAGGDLSGTYPNPSVAKINGSPVIITSPATGAALIYDGANWIDGALDLADNDARTGTLPVANGGTGTTTSTGTGSVVLSASPTLTGTVTATGLVDISGASAGQIKFPATQNPSANANTLDDYEEGTFTPTVTFGGGSTGITYANQVGVYTKIGDSVSYCTIANLTSKGSSTGGASLNGLPFTARNTTFLRPTAFLYCNNMGATVTGSPFGIIVENTTAHVLQQMIAGVASSLTDTHFTNSSTLIIQGGYFV